MREYITQCQGKWWHFFIKPFYGLCFRRKEGARFSNFEVLLPDACEDFCALAVGGQIHLVCQEQHGSILYLNLENETWHKVILLESKSGTAYPKHFALTAVGDFINLFYVIAYQEKYMLVHQIITAEDRPPTVIDRIAPSVPPFSVIMHTGTDMTVLYENESGIGGTRLYRWSRKAFGRFMPVNPAAGCLARCFLPERDGRVRYAAFQTVEGIQNLVYFEKNGDDTYTQPVTVYLDCQSEAAPIFCRDGKRLYMVWQESGGIMSSYSADDGVKWSKPVRYMTPSGSETVLYCISENGDMRYAYGYAREQDLVLYAAPGLSAATPPREREGFRPVGYEAEDFAKSHGGLPDEPAVLPPDPITEKLKQELGNVKEQLLRLRVELGGLTERLERLEQTSTIDSVIGQEKEFLTQDLTVSSQIADAPLAEEGAVDTVLLRDASVGLSSF